ncbi:hypothetical protein QU481_07770 [Crenobacter sp. SG2303]|uniref:DUF2970 domain-containing protein n=1 Tax=Crenobacter oryzisoli TaxID=3056844 RepID=A0ABT7XLY4_9NEIS|nr:hypothetical protein [Crenobacter sp. SG2303]MDN0074789.1 hypothetical protein [Crenobacter sp. SG2303]
MFGRLFKFFVLCFVLYALARWVLDREQRRTLRDWAHTLAVSLLISSLLLVLLFLLGINV